MDNKKIDIITKVAGVYKITNNKNGYVYIGSSVNINKRIKSHVSALKSGRHANRHLQSAFFEYGASGFTFETIIECKTIEEAKMMEQECLSAMFRNSTPTYNICRNVHKSMLGLSHSVETRERQRRAAIGRVFTEEHKKLISKKLQAQETVPNLSEDHKNKIAQALKGNTNGKGNKGKTRTVEVRMEQSKQRKGRIPWNKGMVNAR